MHSESGRPSVVSPIVGEKPARFFAATPTGLQIILVPFPGIASSLAKASSDSILGYFPSLPTGGLAALRGQIREFGLHLGLFSLAAARLQIRELSRGHESAFLS